MKTKSNKAKLFFTDKLHRISYVALISLTPVMGLNAQNNPVWQDENASLEQRVESLLKELTVEEKVALCHAQSKFSSAGVPRLGIPELWMSDGPHGVRAEINWNNWGYSSWTNDSCTAFPALTCLAASFDSELSYIYGKALGAEARYRRKDVILGPGVNIYRTPLNGRNFEYMGEDPYLAAVLVQPYIKGVQENGVATSVKHYALNNQEIWRGHIEVKVSDRALREIYLPAFKAAAEAGAWTFMGAYNKYNGQHCCHNEILLNKILKDEWGYDGVVVTDWGGAHETEEAVNYGLDLEMGTYTNGLTTESEFGFNNYFLADNFLIGVREGKYAVEQLNDKARRILRLMMRTALNSKRPWGQFASEENAAVSKKVAEGGIVLLKNEANMLPLLPGSVRKIAVIGENGTRSMCEGGGSSELKPWREISPLEGIMRKYPDAVVEYTLGYGSGKPSYSHEGISEFNADSLKQEAIKLAKSADVVIYVGGLNKNHKQDCEAADRYIYGLPFGQPEQIEEIARVNKNVIVVLISGNAVETPWSGKVKAIIQGWYSGSEAGNAIASVISGDVNPSGKLPFSFPVNLKDNGAHHYGTLSYPGDSIQQEYMEDILVGYRWHDTKKTPAAYAFGHGLSYTTFKFEKTVTDKSIYSSDEVIKISVPVTNTGTRAGAEVVQIYVSDPKCSVARPVKELKAFNKVFLNPGEKRVISMEIPVSELAFFDEKINDWNVEAGEFIIHTATSSADIKSSSVIKVK